MHVQSRQLGQVRGHKPWGFQIITSVKVWGVLLRHASSRVEVFEIGDVIGGFGATKVIVFSRRWQRRHSSRMRKVVGVSLMIRHTEV